MCIRDRNMGDVIGDLNKRRGQVEGSEVNRSGAQVIKAKVPLSEMFGYVTDVYKRQSATRVSLRWLTRRLSLRLSIYARYTRSSQVVVVSLLISSSSLVQQMRTSTAVSYTHL